MSDKYLDKKILILGGGTSTLDVKWENLDYDYLWTCNEFYLEPRLLAANIDLYLLSYTVDYGNKELINKLKDSKTEVYYEGRHLRGKQFTDEFQYFVKQVNIPVQDTNFYFVSKEESPAAFSGATFRMIITALEMKPSAVYFAGFDGFNREFSNIHAFTKHKGLKPTDTRRTFEGTRESYTTVFMEAYKHFLKYDNYSILQNLGEGFDYNLGTPISKKYFPLREEVYEKTR